MKRRKNKIKLGDVFEFQLPNGKYAYGRCFEGAGYGFYKFTSDKPDNPPIGIKDYFLLVNFQSGPIEDGLYKIVGNDPFSENEDKWIPPLNATHECFGYRISHKGELKEATKEKCEGLESNIIFGIDDVVRRIMKDLGEVVTEEDIVKYKLADEPKYFLLDTDDIAVDVKNRFEHLIDEDNSVQDVFRILEEEFEDELEDDDDGPIIILAFALLQLRFSNKVSEEIKTKALNIVNNGIGLDRWEEEGGKILEDRKEIYDCIKMNLDASK